MADHTPGPWKVEGTRLILPAAEGIRDTPYVQRECWDLALQLAVRAR